MLQLTDRTPSKFVGCRDIDYTEIYIYIRQKRKEIKISLTLVMQEGTKTKKFYTYKQINTKRTRCVTELDLYRSKFIAELF